MQTLQKKIKTQMDMPIWEKSVAYLEFVRFLLTVNDAIESKKISKAPAPSESIKEVCHILEALRDQIEKYSPNANSVQSVGRFGYPEFRQWFSWMCNEAGSLANNLLARYRDKGSSGIPEPQALELTIDPEEISRKEIEYELRDYLCESFGNSTRIDYGTGHEMAFLAFLFCLFKIGHLGRDGNSQTLVAFQRDLQSVALTVLPCYLSLVRQLQMVYRMEPAGSHGVWCLDDYQFIPFFWGSSQLVGDKELSPMHIADAKIYDRYADEYLFFSCLQYINKMKSGPFHEHSPTLHGISGVPTWEKVNGGMVKMYKGEVLGKFPVVQHFGFGKLLPFVPSQSAPKKAPVLKL